MNITERKFVIHILALKAVNAETFDLPENQNAIIVCTICDNPYVNLCLPENTLIIDFHDTVEKKHPQRFTRNHAKRIIKFIHELSSDVTDVYVCCDMGASRSPAVAAALLRISGRNDKDVWLNPYYSPNPAVYLNLCREYGLWETHLSVLMRSFINKLVFRSVQKGNKTSYERWQILE